MRDSDKKNGQGYGTPSRVTPDEHSRATLKRLESDKFDQQVRRTSNAISALSSSK